MKPTHELTKLWLFVIGLFLAPAILWVVADLLQNPSLWLGPQ